jgi:ATP-dependent Clp protease ATP-binding subunit ClpA
MFERLTDRARRVFVLAQEEARLLNHNYIGTEHFLLGLLHEGGSVAFLALNSLGISLEAVREKVAEETIGMAGTAPSGSPPYTPRAKKVLELSLREALQLGHSYIGCEHMLLGLVREGEGVAATVLVSLGADLARVRQAVILERADGVLEVPHEPIQPKVMFPVAPLLTDEELEALGHLSEFTRIFVPTIRGSKHDVREVVDKIHQIQALVMSQAAARAYPDKFRLLGGSLKNKKDSNA